jgi:hypothetical protein
MRSIILPLDGSGRVWVVYSSRIGGTAQLSAWNSGSNPSTATQTIEQNLMDTAEFSAVADTNYGVHVIYRGGTNGNATYAYLAPGSSNWAHAMNVFSSTTTSPSLTVDDSTNDVYAIAIQGTSIAMKRKPAGAAWVDQTPTFPITGRTNNPANLTSNYVSFSASATNSSQILIFWTESNPFYAAWFAAIPIPTAWSPYAYPSDPWDGNGLAPYGQYFSSLGESVSVGSGMLTIWQTDLSIPGRGLDLDFTRVYTEPTSFLSDGNPYNYERYSWAPLGDGWQFNFPWMNNTRSPYRPTYIHLWEGAAYRIPQSFWTTGYFESHQGEHFRLTENSTGVFLYGKSGTTYRFDPASYALSKIVDPLGNNIAFSYANGRISNVTDTVGRIFLFCYNGGFLSAIQQSGTACGTGYLRRVSYTNIGQSLVSVADPAQRSTSYSYSTSPWLPTSVIFPTQWNVSYTYTPVTLAIGTTSYPVFRQLTSTNNANPIRRFDYNYTRAAGDEITASTVRSYNGTQLASITDYAFTTSGVNWNISDAAHNFVQGFQQRFGLHGEVLKEVVLVTDGFGSLGESDIQQKSSQSFF